MTNEQFLKLGKIWLRMGTKVIEANTADTYGLSKSDSTKCLVHMRHFSYGDVPWYQTYDEAFKAAVAHFNETGRIDDGPP